VRSVGHASGVMYDTTSWKGSTFLHMVWFFCDRPTHLGRQRLRNGCCVRYLVLLMACIVLRLQQRFGTPAAAGADAFVWVAWTGRASRWVGFS
jgi:hypothetical protein